MTTNSSSRTLGQLCLPWATAGIWSFAAAGLVFWVLQWPNHDSKAAIAATVSRDPAPRGPNAMVAKALGQSTERPETAGPKSNQLNLVGVVASPSGQGTALIAIDGQPPKAFRVGQIVFETWTLESVSVRQARLIASGAEWLLDLPVMGGP